MLELWLYGAIALTSVKQISSKISGRQGLLLMLVFVCHSHPHQVQQMLIYSEVKVTLNSDTGRRNI